MRDVQGLLCVLEPHLGPSEGAGPILKKQDQSYVFLPVRFSGYELVHVTTRAINSTAPLNSITHHPDVATDFEVYLKSTTLAREM